MTFNSIQIASRKALNDDFKSPFALHTYRGQGAVGNYAHKHISFAYINRSFYPFQCISIEPHFKTISCMRRIAWWPHKTDKLTHKPQAFFQFNLNIIWKYFPTFHKYLSSNKRTKQWFLMNLSTNQLQSL